MNKNIKRFYILTALFWFSLYAFVPILPGYAEDLGASKTLIGIIAGSYGMTQMLIRLPLGAFSDILKKRKAFMVAGICCTIISAFGMFFVRDKYALLVFRAMTGISASTWVIFIVTFSGYFPKSESMRAVGYLFSFNALGTMFAYLSGGAVSNMFGAKYSFLLSAVAGIAALISVALIHDSDAPNAPIEQIQASESLPSRLKDILKTANDRNLIYVSALAVILQYLVFATTVSFTPIIASRLGANDFQKGLLSMTSTLPGLFASALSGTYLVKKFGARATVATGLAIAGICFAAAPFEKSLYALFVTQFLGGFGSSVTMPLLMGISTKNISPGRHATAIGFFQATYGLGMSFGPAIAGIIGDNFGFEQAYVITGVIGLLGSAIVLIRGFD